MKLQRFPTEMTNISLGKQASVRTPALLSTLHFQGIKSTVTKENDNI